HWQPDAMITGRTVLPFLERNGRFCGDPADDAEAIREIERLRDAGVQYIVFAWPAFWWVDHYREFWKHLSVNYRLLLENDRLVVFDLQTLRARPANEDFQVRIARR